MLIIKSCLLETDYKTVLEMFRERVFFLLIDIYVKYSKNLLFAHCFNLQNSRGEVLDFLSAEEGRKFILNESSMDSVRECFR